MYMVMEYWSTDYGYDGSGTNFLSLHHSSEGAENFVAQYIEDLEEQVTYLGDKRWEVHKKCNQDETEIYIMEVQALP